MITLNFIGEHFFIILIALAPLVFAIGAFLELRKACLREAKRKRILIERSKRRRYTAGLTEGKRQQIEHVRSMTSEQFYEFFNK